MQYMILIHTEPYPAPEPGQPGFDEYMAPWLEFNRTHGASGALVAGGQLQPTETATTIRRAFGGGDTIVDGPFAETKEQFGGFYIVEAADLDAALAIATSLPLPAGSFEVRPLLRDVQM
ncbi:YciI family protein [Microbacterium aoyamense]|uniref:YciI family protein n=1 Tax=Microbacterium aoyamense TaxID=344166 RepID=A0ABN2PAI9_9MICO|nr:YciI family protein [Microbacterium aoyamense]